MSYGLLAKWRYVIRICIWSNASNIQIDIPKKAKCLEITSPIGVKEGTYMYLDMQNIYIYTAPIGVLS